MTRFLPAVCALFLATAAFAQDAASSPASDDLHTLRQLIEQQSKQIETLTQQVAKLTQLLDNHPSVAAAATPAVQNMPPAQEGAATAPTESLPKPETVVAPDGSAQHVVSKGETLISIARHYKVSVGELLKVNKIEDARKLQIGQTLIVPASKPAESPNENKL